MTDVESGYIALELLDLPIRRGAEGFPAEMSLLIRKTSLASKLRCN